MKNEMNPSRIQLFEQMLTTDPANTAVLFGLAKEYEKAGRDEEMIDTLNRYLEAADDEGNAFGMLAAAYERIGQKDKAREAYQRGIETAQRHGHPGMAEEYRMTLASNYED
jgi:predicted Zn-dependent protease